MSINLLDFNDDILHIIEMENNQNKIKCDVCNLFYSKKYMSRHLQ